ncbi:NAD(P)-binding domain-containing protein [Sphingomonas sp. JC676]|uniref:ornithine cyclodeaminase family protein n=1 Tax=Sphingomonas sp. JC676 TaxID=2768065 RepID=UPI001657F35E|nr:NAD(P)-binding domain-containing protein [Sphingomonas sp. JC676]MBC9033761.1 NAD(P)-binding domain-containing protein [Sphingomonas sp. JC676]
MRIIELEALLDAVDEAELMQELEAAFVRYSAGQAQVMAVGHLGFDARSGDCHVKGAHLAGDDLFAVKFVNSFAAPANGEPGSDGFIILSRAQTGQVVALLRDRGALTDIRTALTGAIVARAIAAEGTRTLGIVGSGKQAQMQAEAIQRHLPMERVLVSARRPDRADALAALLGGEATDLQRLCAEADVIVTATAARAPLIPAAWVRPGTRIIALGADAPGKQELDPAIVASATVVVDSRAQCFDHGEAGWAVRDGLLDPASVIELGELLARRERFPADRTVVVDLTGVAVQDLAIATAVWNRLPD